MLACDGSARHTRTCPTATPNSYIILSSAVATRRLAHAACRIAAIDSSVVVVTFALRLLLLLQMFMAALRSRCGHYIFALWFLSFIFLSFFLA